MMNGTFCFDPTDGIYIEHFPGNPIVPGSLIVHAFLEALKQMETIHHVCCADNFRFKTFITPGEYPFRIEKTGKGFKCRLYSPDKNNTKTVTTGIITVHQGQA
jgi:3-hydroxyacyl-[acyl-carrier-protein] dehydratase